MPFCRKPLPPRFWGSQLYEIPFSWCVLTVRMAKWCKQKATDLWPWVGGSRIDVASGKTEDVVVMHVQGTDLDAHPRLPNCSLVGCSVTVSDHTFCATGMDVHSSPICPLMSRHRTGENHAAPTSCPWGLDRATVPLSRAALPPGVEIHRDQDSYVHEFFHHVLGWLAEKS